MVIDEKKNRNLIGLDRYLVFYYEKDEIIIIIMKISRSLGIYRKKKKFEK